ncbi:universal stress protein [Hymenobacter properus]|uniref:Universal stress protein n=1 Tax=Hymenobacter properus TaxID=2791026 RepID=A0A931BBY5_9BACT|nr:universal stress protein [Hymenobacter properus]MBF9140949.1 universal stress protein [Hymenobacter properus]MBR7719758.1 universal stress protein [Microvirga sp. SRT04]
MKNILVPTDFSAESHHAFEVALQLAKQTGAAVRLLHVLEAPEAATANFSAYGGPVNGSELPNSEGSIDDVFIPKLMEATKRRLHALRTQAETLAPGVAVADGVEMGRIGDGILSAVERHGADLVVMGAQGHGAMENFFVGSNTERIIRLANVPVLTVKHQQPQFEVRNIVFPSDFTEESVGAIAGLQQVQTTFPNATIHLLHVADGANSQANQQHEQAFAQRAQLTNFQTSTIAADNTSAGIEQFAKQVNADLVVIPTHARSGLSRYFNTSIAETVATRAFPPVLTYHLADA